MKSYVYFAIAFLVIAMPFSNSYSQSGPKEVRLKGKLLNFGTTAVLEDFSELQYIIPKGGNLIITPDTDSSFEISFPLAAPNYFRLGRNKLYLTPGDDLDLIIDQSSDSKATFKGRGSVANNYLKKTSYPKGGSYLNAGRDVKKLPSQMLEYILQTAASREKELLSLKGVSPAFIRIEKARIKADIIQSIKSVDGYLFTVFRQETESFKKLYWDELVYISKKLVDSLKNNFVDPQFLQIEVYRDIIEELSYSGVAKEKIQAIDDWKKAYKLAYLTIKRENDKSKIPEFLPAIDSVKTKKYKDALLALYNDKMKFGNGDKVIDFAVRTADLKEVALSSLKGKIIYIDLWATWCGPCMAEMPFLEKLKDKYSANPDVEIVSLSIDDNDAVWLRDLERRKAGGHQWRIERAKLVDYQIEGIPRYILINKNFVIAEMDAPHASDSRISELIDGLLKKS
jgi:thiol-disulfide isomerase/thioredoxin